MRGEVEPGGAAAMAEKPAGQVGALSDAHRRSGSQLVIFTGIFVFITYNNYTRDYSKSASTGGSGDAVMLAFAVRMMLISVTATVVFLARGLRQLYLAQIVQHHMKKSMNEDTP